MHTVHENSCTRLSAASVKTKVSSFPLCNVCHSCCGAVAGDALAAYNILRAFSWQIRLSPFAFEELCAALFNPNPSPLMDELHVWVLNAALGFFSAFAYALHGSLHLQAHEHPPLDVTVTVMNFHPVHEYLWRFTICVYIMMGMHFPLFDVMVLFVHGFAMRHT